MDGIDWRAVLRASLLAAAFTVILVYLGGIFLLLLQGGQPPAAGSVLGVLFPVGVLLLASALAFYVGYRANRDRRWLHGLLTLVISWPVAIALFTLLF